VVGVSEYIAHIAICDDARAIVLQTRDLCDRHADAIRSHHRSARLGAMTSQGDRHTVDLLVDIRGRPPGIDRDRLLAYHFGWRTHQAADRQFKAIFRLVEPEVYNTEELDGPTRVSILQDLFLLHELYAGGEDDPFLEEMLTPDPDRFSSAFDGAFVSMRRIQLLGLQAALNRRQDADRWLDRADRRTQEMYVDVDRYRREFQESDAAAIRDAVERHRFYAADDPMIAVARDARRGEPIHPARLEGARTALLEQSHYARALARCIDYALASEAYLARRIDEAELASRYEVDTPHTPRAVYWAVEEDRPQLRDQVLDAWHRGEPME